MLPSRTGGLRAHSTMTIVFLCGLLAWLSPQRLATAQPGLQPPVATLGDPQFDAYDPAQAPALAPSPGMGGLLGDVQNSTWGQPIRLVQNVGLDYTHLGDNGGSPLGLDEIEVHGTFAWPFRPGVAPLEFTPGFAVQFWDGPPGFEFPEQTYSGYLDIGWRPQITHHSGLELAVRPGIYSDFHKLSSEAIRIKGKGLFIFTASPEWQFVGGLLYLDRVDVKLLPAGGAIWTPTPDIRYEIIFPQPKLAHRLSVVGNTEWWGYIAGEYGGDSWDVDTVGGRMQTDYNDLRLILGAEFKPTVHAAGMSGRIEIGYVFNRELVTAGGAVYDASDTYMIRGSLSY